jgi:hypothetical protein
LVLLSTLAAVTTLVPAPLALGAPLIAIAGRHCCELSFAAQYVVGVGQPSNTVRAATR